METRQQKHDREAIEEAVENARSIYRICIVNGSTEEEAIKAALLPVSVHDFVRFLKKKNLEFSETIEWIERMTQNAEKNRIQTSRNAFEPLQEVEE